MRCTKTSRFPASSTAENSRKPQGFSSSFPLGWMTSAAMYSAYSASMCSTSIRQLVFSAMRRSPHCQKWISTPSRATPAYSASSKTGSKPRRAR